MARAVYERKEKLSSDGVERSRVETLLDNYLEVRSWSSTGLIWGWEGLLIRILLFEIG